ncbi:pyrroloquinoline quinone biosynthesis peptide chaperone PqqD [Deferrisoma camini]|uniref:pyrroloquinoline quinone biosynthesis peptide chaperone PqqD n=1 Tax=Deferrisoma camini TaxID=1035120 RepID=UPI00046D5BB0|nr:pyrroloquinoline quinone biosynthesis peptide chaperone PqqD [Deferrisoma camini]
MTVLRRNPSLAWRDEPGARERILAALERGEDVADEGWVILVHAGRMHQLNLLAGEIWLLADGTRDAAAIAAELAGRYDAPADEIREDVEAFVAECLSRGWLVAEDA